MKRLKIAKNRFVDELEASGPARESIPVYDWFGNEVERTERWAVGMFLLARLDELRVRIDSRGLRGLWDKLRA